MPVTTTILTTGSTVYCPPFACNWRHGGPVNISITASSSFACDVNVQYTLDDYQALGIGSSQAKWSTPSSVPGQAATHWLSSTAYPDGILYTFTGPVAAVRAGSSVLGAMGVGNTLTVRIMQGEIS
jgi:hypothetical protein